MSAAVMLSRVMGLAREIVMARVFGAGLAYDAYMIGFRVPNLTRDLFAEGALSAAFIPTFTDYLSSKSKEEANRLANLVATTQFLLVGSFCLLGIIFSPQIVMALAPGFLEVPGKFELAVSMTQTMFPYLLMVALAALAMGVLNASNQFAVPALASTFFNIGSLGFGLSLGFWAGPYLGITPIEGMAIGVVLGGLLQLLWQLPSVYRSGFRFRPQIDFSDPGVRRVYRLMGPAVLGAAAVQINVMVNTYFATQIVDPVRGLDGPVSWLGYAFRFMQLPLGVFGVAIASATLPAISRSASSGNIAEFRETLSHSLGMVFLLTVPSSVGLAVLGESIIGAIYQGGRFETYDTQQTAIALSYYAIGLTGYSAIKVLIPAFYALGNGRTPMIVSLCSIAINIVAVLWLLSHTNLNHAALALSTSTVALFGFVVLFWLIRNRIDGIYGRNLAASTVKILLASAAMGLGVIAIGWMLDQWMEPSRITHIVKVLTSVPVGLAIFYAGCRYMKVPELEMATAALLGKRGSGRAKLL